MNGLIYTMIFLFSNEGTPYQISIDIKNVKWIYS